MCGGNPKSMVLLKLDEADGLVLAELLHRVGRQHCSSSGWLPVRHFLSPMGDSLTCANPMRHQAGGKRVLLVSSSQFPNETTQACRLLNEVGWQVTMATSPTNALKMWFEAPQPSTASQVGFSILMLCCDARAAEDAALRVALDQIGSAMVVTATLGGDAVPSWLQKSAALILQSPLQVGDLAHLGWRATGAAARDGMTPSGQHIKALLYAVDRDRRALEDASMTDKLVKPLQRLIGGSKTRFVDTERNFDLNLCNITPSCIAMGLPAEKSEGLYRNNIREVSRFFETFHTGPDNCPRYKIFNLCGEPC